MKSICKELETIVNNSTKLLEKVELKELTHRYSDDRDNTHINLSISFDKEALSWVSTSLQWGIKYQFSITFFRQVSKDWYKNIQFSSDFYDLDKKDQLKRVSYFKKNFQKVVDLTTNDENIKLKISLLEKRKEIEKQLSTL